MVKAYNFLASWQLFPEKGSYDFGERPKSGIYKIDAVHGRNELTIYRNWVTLENQAFAASFTIPANGLMNAIEPLETTYQQGADTVQADFADGNFEVRLYSKGKLMMLAVHEILPNGFLKITQQGITPPGGHYTNIEVYHKQMSVLPYAASVSGAVIRPTELGVMKHKALAAMEEQTNMQLDQIRKQIELLAQQANEIQQRKELSMIIYDARISFKPNIGHVYYLYQKNDDSYTLSMVAPGEWGKSGPFKSFIANVKLLADHTWKEV